MKCLIRRVEDIRPLGPFHLDEVMHWILDGMLGPADSLSMDEGLTWLPVASLGETRSFFSAYHSTEDQWPSLSSTLPKRRTKSLDLAPMIDVLFLLLIFFLVTARMESDVAQEQAESERHVEVSAPVVEEEAETPKESAGEPVQVLLQSDGTLFYQGRAVAVADLVRDFQRLTDGGQKTLEVVVYGDRLVSYGQMAEVVASLDNIPGTTVMLGMITEGAMHE